MDVLETLIVMFIQLWLGDSVGNTHRRSQFQAISNSEKFNFKFLVQYSS